MPGSGIDRLLCRYNAAVPAGRGQDLAARLDRIARRDLPRLLDDALAAAFRNDPAVYVWRRFDVRTALALQGPVSDESLGRRWAASLAAAIRRAAIGPPATDLPLVRFDDEASYLAAFLADLAGGQALERWYFAPLRPYRRPTASATARAVLEAHGEALDAILVHLVHDDELERVLGVLDPGTVAFLWRRSPHRGPSRAESETFVVLARRLAESLGMIRLGSGAPRRAELVQRYGALAAADWSDPAALADAVVDALRFLIAEGVAGTSKPPDLDRLSDLLGDGWDWLDGRRLRAGLEKLLRQEARPMNEPPTAASAAPAGAPSPTRRQEALLADLHETLAAVEVRLDPSRPTSPSNALRLYGRLVERHPRWRESSLARRLVDQLLHAWERRRPVPGLPLLPAPRPIRPAAPPSAVAPRGSAAVIRASDGIDTDCAGTFLLLRSVLELRLPEIVERTGFPAGFGDSTPLGSVLVALGVAWGGDAAVRDGRLDPALAWLGGFETAPSVGELRSGWRPAPGAAGEEFHALLRRLATGQRLEVDDDPGVLREALEAGPVVAEDDVAKISFAAAVALRSWSRWLRGFGSASLPFLLENAVHRRGRLELDDDVLVVEMSSAPLDIVVEMAGYFAELEPLPWLGGRRVRYRFCK